MVNRELALLNFLIPVSIAAFFVHFYQQWQGNLVTYEHFYKVRHNKLITDRNQCLLISKRTDRDRARGFTDDIVLVPEFCCLTGLSDEQRSDFKLMSVSDVDYCHFFIFCHVELPF